MTANSIVSEKPAKPKKPSPDFPLFAHATKRWCKKINGKFHYFGPWDDPDAALKKYQDEREAREAGRVPRAVSPDTLTVHKLANEFMLAKEQQRDAGDIRPTTFSDYHATCKAVLDAFGKDRPVDDLTAIDFQLLRARFAKRYGPHALSREVQQVRTLFKYGYDAGLIDKPVRFGPMFVRPAKRILRAHRQQNGDRMFEPAELKRLIDAAKVPLKAMILLGINCAYGNTDCARLPKSVIDLTNGWVKFPRPKTAVERKCPLWPETIAALKAAMAERPNPKKREHSGLAFLTKYGQPWVKSESYDNPVTKEFRKLLDDLKLHRPGLGFYALRHTFETVAGESKDQIAVDHVMGHVDESMAARYRERISDDRLHDVVNFVRNWLFAKEKKR